MVGSQLAHYKIVAELGRGGMGIVYKAEDTKLNRSVALKVLPASALASDDDRARFFREAQAAAQLHHPNIATVFEIDEAIPLDEDGSEIGTSDGPRPFIAMEFIEGETLQDFIKKGPMKLTEAVSVAAQVAEALKAAHSKEIVHRDIKSANVMLTKEGVAKVLDFGLAKTNQSTMLTRMGSTLGTVAYMSPEQARGQDVDGRSDLYSLGTMLYEMISGQLPFGGEYEQAVVYGILNENPEALTALRTGVPMGLEWIVNKLMAKEPRHRYQTAADLVADLETVDMSGSGMSRRSMPAAAPLLSAGPGSPAKQDRLIVPVWGWVIAGFALLAAAATGWFVKTVPEPPLQPSVRFSLEVPAEEALDRVNFRALAISPNGERIAYVTRQGIRVRSLADLERSMLLEGISSAINPTFSPDGEWLSFESTTSKDLMRVPIAGGSMIKTADLPGTTTGISWGADGFMYLGLGNGGLGRVSETGGTVEVIHEAGGDWIANPRILPGYRSVIYSVSPATQESEIRIFDLVSAEESMLFAGGFDAHYIKSTGNLIYFWNGSLFELPFDAQTLSLKGGPIPLVDNVSTALFSGAGQFDISDNETLIKLFGSGQSAVGSNLAWLTPDGSVETISPNFRAYWVPRVSPDGNQVAVSTTGRNGAVWVVDASRGTSREFATVRSWPIWSPDGKYLAYGTNAGDILVAQLDTPSEIDTLFTSTGNVTLTDWSSDGRYIVYFTDTAGLSSSNIEYIDVETRETTEFLANDIDTDFGRLSPDRRWMAYETDEEGGKEEVHIRRFPGGGNVLRISNGGGTYPVWRPDGNGLYYATPDQKIVLAEIDADRGTLTSTEIIFEGPLGGVAFPSFGIHPIDGRLLILVPNQPVEDKGRRTTLRRLDFIINWTTELMDR
ncbi:MAG: hypothetical protein BMS9Abin05_2041 [Rhodothermia bacterium]|nr:MAG: hypothetical protein BMS9Abin05_2041 [Rhodothermia bacterium]